MSTKLFDNNAERQRAYRERNRRRRLETPTTEAELLQELYDTLKMQARRGDKNAARLAGNNRSEMLRNLLDDAERELNALPMLIF
jgi:hypothetical protein